MREGKTKNSYPFTVQSSRFTVGCFELIFFKKVDESTKRQYGLVNIFVDAHKVHRSYLQSVQYLSLLNLEL